VRRVQINRGSLDSLEEGRGVREAIHGWGGLTLDSAQHSVSSACIPLLRGSQDVYKGLWLLAGGVMGTGGFCPGSDQEMEPLATVASLTLL